MNSVSTARVLVPQGPLFGTVNATTIHRTFGSTPDARKRRRIARSVRPPCSANHAACSALLNPISDRSNAISRRSASSGAQQRVVPPGVQCELVVGEDIRPALRLAEPREFDARHRILGEFVDIEHLGAYIEALQASAVKPTVKQHLIAIRMLFDWLVVGQVIAPQSGTCGARAQATSCRAARRQYSWRNKPAACSKASTASTLVGLRDRALMGVMTYAFARIGTVVAMRIEDYYPAGKRWWVRLREKGGKSHEMPAHHKLE
jgi:hypothetical protein